MNVPSPFRRPLLRRLGVAGVAGSLVLLAAAPGAAAPTVAEGEATALRISLAGESADSGSYTATNDGSGETTTGSNEPALTAVGGQDFLTAGTLFQDADTQVIGRRGLSAACAGVAGDGGTAVAVGENQFCLDGDGDNASINAGSFSLTGVEIVPGVTLPPELTEPVDDAIQQALEATGAALTLNLGVIQSRCSATPTALAGDSEVTDATLDVTVGDESFNLLTLPTVTEPNQKVVSEPSAIVEDVNNALRAQFDTALRGELEDIGNPLTDQVIEPVNNQLIAQLDGQLQPLEDNLLDITLNKQDRTDNEITVTALDAQVVPAAQEAEGFSLAELQIGESRCFATRAQAPQPPDNPAPAPDGPSGPGGPGIPQDPFTPDDSGVPTSVPSGETLGEDAGLLAAGALGGLLVLSGAAGVATYRRALRD